MPFTLTAGDIVIPDRCPVFGIRLRRTAGKRGSRDTSPSLDRIVPERGYTPSNTIVVSTRANRAKNDLTVAEMRALAVFYSTNTKETPPCSNGFAT